MLSPRWRKVFQDIWSNKTRTLLVVLSIAVGVFAVGTIAGTQIMLERDLNFRYMEVNPASVSFIVGAFDDELVEMVRGIRGVGEAQGRRQVSVRVQAKPGEWKDMRLYAFSNFRDVRVNKIWPVHGEWPPPNRALVIERQGPSLLNTQEGESLLIETADGKQKTIPVVGLAHEVNNFPSSLSGTAYGYIGMDTLEWLGLSRTYNMLDVVVAEKHEDKAHIEAMAQRIQDRIEKSGYQVHDTYIPEPLEHPAYPQVSPLLMLLGVLGFLSLLASSFLVVNTLSAVLTQQVRQIGIMKAVGATTRQITGMYVTLVLGFGLLGLLVGTPLGILGARLFSDFLAGLINFDVTSYAIPPGVFALEVAVGLLVPLLASLFPIIKGARISVREAVSDFGIQASGATGFLDPLLERLRFLSRPMLLSLRNTFRARGRRGLTLLTLTLAGSLFISVFSVRSSLLRTMDHALEFYNYDIYFGFRQPHRMNELRDLALAMPGVEHAESWSYAHFTRIRPDGVESQSFQLTGVQPNSDIVRPVLLSGRWLLPEDENAIVINTELRQEQPDIQAGDELTLKINGKESTWTVVGIAEGILSYPRGFANMEQVQSLGGNYGRATNVMVRLDQHDVATQQAMNDRLKEHFKAAGLQVSMTEPMYTVRERAQFQFDLLIIFLLIMAILLAAVGGLGLMGTMSINVLERTREIGVMRAIGASTGSVLGLVLVEGLLIGGISGLLAGGVALPLSRVLSHAVGVLMLQVPLTYEFSMVGLLIWLALVLFIAGLASLIPALRAAKLTVRDVLSYQ